MKKLLLIINTLLTGSLLQAMTCNKENLHRCSINQRTKKIEKCLQTWVTGKYHWRTIKPNEYNAECEKAGKTSRLTKEKLLALLGTKK